MRAARYFPVIALAACAFLLPPLLTATKTAFLMTQLTMSAYYALASLGLCALMGYAGQISLGQAGFFAIGGYASSFISTRDITPFASGAFARSLDIAGLLVRGTDPYGNAVLSLSPWIACICAVLLAALIAALIGTPVLRLKGHYLAMATLGFGLVIEKIARGTKILGGADGLSNVPGFPILPGLVVTGGRAARASNFTIAWMILALGLLALINLVGSRAGRALRALHDGEEAAGAMGIDTAKYKLDVFILGAVYAAIAGMLLSHFNGSIGPGEANVMKSVRYVAIVAVGGMANLTGTLVAGLALNFLSLRGVFGSLDDAVFGVILILVMLFAPNGKTFLSKLTRRKGAAE
ncbi:MAG: branched-chain amino acid ABC transporter permease [Rectinemataceae bacterium]|jgi:branched-chain amino acid transport system permease protein